MRQVQSFLQGLTAALQLKGQEPLMFPQELRGTVDVFKFALAARQQVDRNNVPAAASGVNATLTVPDNEIWFVQYAAARIVAANNNDVLQCRLQYSPDGIGDFITLAHASSPQAQPGTTGRFFRALEESACHFHPDQPLIMKPGDTIVAIANLVQAGGGSVPQLFLEVLSSRFTP